MIGFLIVIITIYLLATRVHVSQRRTQHSRTLTVKIGKTPFWSRTSRL